MSRAVAALRRGREALTDIEAQLGALLDALHAPEPHLESGAPEKLAGATRDAVAALSSLGELRRLLPSPR